MSVTMTRYEDICPIPNTIGWYWHKFALFADGDNSGGTISGQTAMTSLQSGDRYWLNNVYYAQSNANTDVFYVYISPDQFDATRTPVGSFSNTAIYLLGAGQASDWTLCNTICLPSITFHDRFGDRLELGQIRDAPIIGVYNSPNTNSKNYRMILWGCLYRPPK